MTPFASILKDIIFRSKMAQRFPCKKVSKSDIFIKATLLHLIDIPMFYIGYLTMLLKVKMHSSAIRKLMYGVCVCMGDNTFMRGSREGTGVQDPPPPEKSQKYRVS